MLMKFLFTALIAFSAGIALNSLLNTTSVPVQRTVHFRGQFKEVQFCEGDAGELSSLNNVLSIKCADQRKTLLSIYGNDKKDFTNWNLSATEWATSVIHIQGSR